MLYGASLLALYCVIRGIPFDMEWNTRYIGSLLYLVIPGSVIGFTAYLTLVGRMGPERAAYCTVLFPLVALNVSAFAEGYQWTAPALDGAGAGDAWQRAGVSQARPAGVAGQSGLRCARRQPLNTCGLTRSCGRSPSNALRKLASARWAMASRVSWVAEPIWGRVTAFLSWNRGESLSGSFFVHIQPGPANRAMLQGVDQRGFVHHGATEIFTKMALGFISFNSRGPIR